MGQQQLLLIILGVIIVGIAIAVGLSLFAANSVQANKDAITNDLNNICANAYQYRIRTTSMGGGNNSYANYTIPTRLSSNSNATYSISVAGTQTGITIKGLSGQDGTSYVTAAIDVNGNVTQTPSGF
ncbi:MAG: hypothetical protein ABSA44_00330 [Bacteroidota bacterium]|jgi:hypothetical protein